MSEVENQDAPSRLDNHLHIERIYDADREAMLAALRVVLGLPKVRPADLEVK